jgi:hypothetical protein
MACIFLVWENFHLKYINGKILKQTIIKDLGAFIVLFSVNVSPVSYYTLPLRERRKWWWWK